MSNLVVLPVLIKFVAINLYDTGFSRIILFSIFMQFADELIYDKFNRIKERPKIVIIAFIVFNLKLHYTIKVIML